MKKEEGLSQQRAHDLLLQYGKNEIKRREKQSRLRDFTDQLTHPLALLLWAAAGLAWIDGILPLAVAILAVILLNAAFAFLQELQAERATEALQEYLPPMALVRRSGLEEQIPADEIVPGDIILLEEGDRIPADAQLLRGSLEIDASPLTGESEPVLREAGRGDGEKLQRSDLIFSGTLCTGGEAAGVVLATGMHTEIGRIAALSQRVRSEPSPLQKSVSRAAWIIALVAVAVGGIFLLLSVTLAGLSFSQATMFSIGILVANVPEGLLPTITLALAVAVRAMARRQALLKRLTSVETLGSCDVICTDKTGTLTEGKMTVHSFWSAGAELRPKDDLDPSFEPLLETALLCNNASLQEGPEGERERFGDPGESALLLAGDDLGYEARGRRERLFRFDARLKRMSTLDQESGALILHCKGAPMEILGLCSDILDQGKARTLGEADRQQAQKALDGYSSAGLRVLALAQREVAPEIRGAPREDLEQSLVFLGLVALRDPARKEVPNAVSLCREAGVRIIPITGDHGLTAAAICREVGIVGKDPHIVSGSEIESMSHDRLRSLLQEKSDLIVARSNPETKLRLVDALKDEGHTVAMTGDGVNDAPALRRADIGIAMGRSGTEVAREAATMVLADDNFASITKAIEEGRVVYDNIKKFITYIFAHSTPEVVPFLFFALSGGAIPLPLTALLILAVDLGTETLPALALGREPAEPGVMQQPPRRRGQHIISRDMLVRAWLWLGLLEAALVMGGFFFVLINAGWSPGDSVAEGSPLYDDYLKATAMTFAGITACQVGAAFATRTTHTSVFTIGLLSNKLLLGGILFELLFAAAIIYLPPLQEIFLTRSLGWAELLILLLFPFLVWGSDEMRKWFIRSRQ